MGYFVKYAVVIENAGPNFSAYVPDLPGCVATGPTAEEVEQNIRDALEFHLDGMREDGTPIPPPSSRVDYVEVATQHSFERTVKGGRELGERGDIRSTGRYAAL